MFNFHFFHLFGIIVLVLGGGAAAAGIMMTEGLHISLRSGQPLFVSIEYMLQNIIDKLM